MTEVKDPKEQKKLLDQLTKQREDEFNYLITRLTELTPMSSTNSTDPSTFDISMIPTQSINVGGKMIDVVDTEADESQIATRSLMRWYDVKFLNNTNQASNEQDQGLAIESHRTVTNKQDYYDYGADRDEYMEAWLKQKYSGNSSKGKGEDDSDNPDDQGIILV